MVNLAQKDRVDCVLIYPPWTVLHGRSFLNHCLPPLGILSIAGFVESKGFTVKVIDTNAERMNPEQLDEQLRKYRPRCVGITVLSPMVVSANAIAKQVKRIVPDCTVVMGGVHAEAYPERMLQNSSVDLIVRGDGEQPMADIVAGKPWDQILSASYLRPDLTVAHTKNQKIKKSKNRNEFR